MRVIDAVCLALAVGVAGYVYKVKHEAEIAQDAKVALEREIAIVSRDVHLLEADLAALDHPGRMQNLVGNATDELALEPIAARHFVRLSDIPFRSELIPTDVELGDEGLPVAASDSDEAIAIGATVGPGTGDGIAGLLAGQREQDTSVQSLDALLTELIGTQTDAASVESDDGIAALLEGRE